MLKEWRKFRGWKVLEYFLSRPNSRIHIKGISRELSISPLTAETYLKLYAEEGILDSERTANSIQFRLNNDDYLTKRLKCTWFLMLLKESGFIKKFINENPEISVVSLFGAYASGEYTEHSDVDLFVITQQRKLRTVSISRMESELRKTTEITRFSIGEWRKMKKSKNSFVESFMKNNLILYGELP